jgi:hypothetical protein
MAPEFDKMFLPLTSSATVKTTDRGGAFVTAFGYLPLSRSDLDDFHLHRFARTFSVGNRSVHSLRRERPVTVNN